MQGGTRAGHGQEKNSEIAKKDKGTVITMALEFDIRRKGIAGAMP
jgi:hypothetical protein